MSNYFDISIPISNKVQVYEGDPCVNISTFASIKEGKDCNVSQMNLGCHTGTHVDAPNHFIENSKTVDQLDLNKCNGECFVLQIDDENLKEIQIKHLDALPTNGVKRILFSTRNSKLWKDEKFRDDFVTISNELAEELVKREIECIGIDYLSVGDKKTHITLLSKEIFIIEGLDFRNFKEQGLFELQCLPLKLVGGTGDGAPARVILRPIQQ